MEDCNSNTPSGESGQVGGRQGAIDRRNAAARNYFETGDPRARTYAIGQHDIAELYPKDGDD